MIVSMTSLRFTSHSQGGSSPGAYLDEETQGTGHPMLRALSLASLVIGATALGLYLGRELRQRYKFKRRTPYDFYSKAGDPVAMTEYGMGI